MASIKKILLVGEFNPDTNIYTYPSSFYRSLVKLGFDVECFNSKKNYLPFFTCSMSYGLPGRAVGINDVIVNNLLKKKA